LLDGVLFPGAGYVAWMIAASGATKQIVLEDLSFKRMLMFEDRDAAKKTQIVLNPSSVKSYTCASISNFQSTPIVIL
jgi:Polyketide synthase dehydratase